MRVWQTGILASWIVLGGASTALASTGLESPDSGVVQTGRGGAWLVKADDPLAAFFNPAALVRQASGVHLGAHIMFGSMCFTRVGEDGMPVNPAAGIPGPGAEGGPDAEVCRESSVFPNPQLAANFQIRDDLAIGLAVLGPHAVGNQEWPETLEYKRGDTTLLQPAPQRYLLISADALLVFPTLAVSYAPTPELSFGAGFVWGIASVQFANFAEAVSPSTSPFDDFNEHQDLRAELSAKDLFVPGVVASAAWSPARTIDLAGWFKWQDAVHASTGDLTVLAKYWKPGGAPNDDDPSIDGPGNPDNITDAPDSATSVKIKIPMEAKLGVRFHQPREGWASAPGVRDPLSEDVFDIELDVTWANNSAVDAVELRFKDDIFIAGSGGGKVPMTADVPHNWKDVLGVRLGGDYVILPGQLAARAGGFFETKGQDDEYLNVDFHVGQKIGLSAGATLRLGPVDVSAAYAHTFYGTLDNGGKGKLRALSGDKDSRPEAYRSRQVVNGGKLTASLDELVLGATLRF
jgi:long-chain fatty acid transport protein